MKVLLRCGDSDTGCGERDWHIWVHTHEHCESRRRGSWGHWDTTHQPQSGLTSTRRPGPTIEALWPGRGESQERPMVEWSEPGGPGLDWLGWRLSLVSWWGRPEPGWTHWGSASVLSSPGSQCPSHRGQTSVSGVSGVTLRHSVLVVCWEFILERSENRGWLLFESVYYGD